MPVPAPLTLPVRTTQRLFSSEVALAEAAEGPKPLRDVAYDFNGPGQRPFYENADPYVPDA